MLTFIKIFGLLSAVLLAVCIACSCIEAVVDYFLGD